MDDREILELFWQRSEQAIAAVEARFGTMCRRIAMNLLRDEQDAEECISDTYHNLWQSIPPDRPEKLTAYVAKMTRNLAMKRLTYRTAAKRTAVTVSFEELSECIPSAQTVEQELEGRELTRLLEQFLRKLEPEARYMFLRRYWFFDSICQIATETGVSESKVKVKLFRVRKELKDYLAKEADIYVG